MNSVKPNSLVQVIDPKGEEYIGYIIADSDGLFVGAQVQDLGGLYSFHPDIYGDYDIAKRFSKWKKGMFTLDQVKKYFSNRELKQI